MDKWVKDEKPALIFISDEGKDLKFLFKPQTSAKNHIQFTYAASILCFMINKCGA